MKDSKESVQSPDEGPKPAVRPKVFLTYCKEDQEVAIRIAEILERIPYEVWYRDKSPEIGEFIEQQVDVAIEEHDTAIVLCGEHSAKDKRLNEEIERLLFKKLNKTLNSEVKIFPVLVADGEIPAGFEGRTNIDLRFNFPKSLVRFLDRLIDHLGQ